MITPNPQPDTHPLHHTLHPSNQTKPDWCGPCKMMMPELIKINDELATRGGQVRVRGGAWRGSGAWGGWGVFR
jgi:hypothetical protein